MKTSYPKRPKTDVTAQAGVNLVSTIINDTYGWIFRRNHQEHDFGVDGYIDFVSEGGDVTGQTIAVQIKTGRSYLSENGSIHWYTDTKEHLNYFLNLPISLLLIICDPEKKACYWDKLDNSNVYYQGDKWKYPIPKIKLLLPESKAEITGYFKEVKDYVSEHEDDLSLINLIDDDSFVQYAIPREDIESKNVNNLRNFISRVTRNEKLTLAMQGKLYISTYGYERDSREVHEIKEVKEWAIEARKVINEWYLCVGNTVGISTIFWIAACSMLKNKSTYCKLEDGRDGYSIEADSTELVQFMQECFHGLNLATEKWNWAKSYNYELSKKIQKELFQKIPSI